MSAEKAAELGLRPRARLVAQKVVGVGPGDDVDGANSGDTQSWRRRGSAGRYRSLRGQRGVCAGGAGVEARATADMERVNVNGGAIALGHPLGCIGHAADDDAAARAGATQRALRPADDVLRRWPGYRDNHRTALGAGISFYQIAATAPALMVFSVSMGQLPPPQPHPQPLSYEERGASAVPAPSPLCSPGPSPRRGGWPTGRERFAPASTASRGETPSWPRVVYELKNRTHIQAAYEYRQWYRVWVSGGALLGRRRFLARGPRELGERSSRCSMLRLSRRLVCCCWPCRLG